MDIRPSKDYKKPLYALGLATVMLAATVTGCVKKEDEPVRLMGVTDVGPTTTLTLDGETTVVFPMKDPTNPDYDLSPYRITSKSFYLQNKRYITDEQLKEYAETKLDAVTKVDDFCYKGLYQDQEFTIVAVDKFRAFLNSENYYDDQFYDDILYLKEKYNAAESGLIDVYKDPTELFLVVTPCRDFKVVYEFFVFGTEYKGNREFPKDYEYFCSDEFKMRVMEPQYALRWSKENHVVLFEDSKCTSGKDMWEAFTYSVAAHKSANVLLADYHSANKKKKQAEKLYFYYISYNYDPDRTYFYVRVRRSNIKEESISGSLDYFKHFKGTWDLYVLTNEKDMTPEEAGKLATGPNSGEFLDHFVLRFNKE